MKYLKSTGKLQITPDKVYDFTADDLKEIEEIGRGNYGTVTKMIHKHSDTVMAVKVSRCKLTGVKVISAEETTAQLPR